jgi:hypothetical protein
MQQQSRVRTPPPGPGHQGDGHQGYGRGGEEGKDGPPADDGDQGAAGGDWETYNRRSVWEALYF